MNCTCGSAAVNGPGHSSWCDYIQTSKETGWDEFARMSREGWSGVYIYVTRDPFKLQRGMHHTAGNWQILRPSQMREFVRLHGKDSVTRMWIEGDCTESMDTIAAAMTSLGRAGVLRYCTST